MKGGGPGKPCGGRKPERVNVGYVVVSSISKHKPRSRQMGPKHSAAGNLKTSWDKSPHHEAHFHTSKDTPGRLRAALPAGPSGRHGLTIHAEGANPSRPMQPRGVEATRRDAFFLPWERPTRPGACLQPLGMAGNQRRISCCNGSCVNGSLRFRRSL